MDTDREFSGIVDSLLESEAQAALDRTLERVRGWQAMKRGAGQEPDLIHFIRNVLATEVDRRLTIAMMCAAIWRLVEMEEEAANAER